MMTRLTKVRRVFNQAWTSKEVKITIHLEILLVFQEITNYDSFKERNITRFRNLYVVD